MDKEDNVITDVRRITSSKDRIIKASREIRFAAIILNGSIKANRIGKMDSKDRSSKEIPKTTRHARAELHIRIRRRTSIMCCIVTHADMTPITKVGSAHALGKITFKTLQEIKRISSRELACEHSISAYPMDQESEKVGFYPRTSGKLNGELRTIRFAPEMSGRHQYIIII